MTSKELKKRREAMGLNGREMAAALKTPQPTYWKWENGRRRVPGIVEVALDGLEFKNANITARG